MWYSIDLDFQKSQTSEESQITCTKQKYTNCTNDIKFALKDLRSLENLRSLKDLKGHAAAIEYYSEVFYQSSPNPQGTESKVWIELSPKQKARETTSAFPGLEGALKAWDTNNTNDPMNSVQMEQVQYDSYLPSQEQVEEKAGRHANDFPVIRPEPNDESSQK